ncbi:SMEK domain-containing protein [Lancefieldella rimae]|uniref:SMEK domain-containing protein n=1 Tax=Lancefieldella rimae TaxID=1383 RepID=UPI0002E78EE4|nr:SMEK domain-containing protein [Lancefieldella rimae]
MTLARSTNTDKFNELLVRLGSELQNEANNNYLSQAVHAEETYKRILNVVYGWSLRNLNQDERNASAVDLIDEANHIVVQISVSATRQKVKNTLANHSIEQYAQARYRIKFVACGARNFPKFKELIENPYNIDFDQKNDCIVAADLADQFAHLDIDEQEVALHVLRQELGDAFMLTPEFVDKHFASAKKALGSRYSSELTVPVDESDYFDAVLNSDVVFERVRTKLAVVKTDAENLVAELKSIEEIDNEIIDAAIQIASVTKDALNVTSPAAMRKVVNAYRAYENRAFLSDNPIERTSRSLNLHHAIFELRSQCSRDGIELLGMNFVLFTGKGGIGKSHLLADFCSRAIESGLPAFLVLGQNFVSSIPPLERLSELISGSSDYRTCLAEIERYTVELGRVALIAVDALNEGDGKGYWPNHIQHFLDEITRYPHIRVVASVRSSYESQVIPQDFVESNSSVEKIELRGFESSPSAMDSFCDFYGIEPPAFPPYGEEYSNPLFLKTLCRAISERGTGRFELNLTFIDAVNICLDQINGSISKSLQCSTSSKVVQKAVSAIVANEHFSRSGYLTFDEANEAIVKAVSSYTTSPSKVLEMLEAEDIVRIDEYGDSPLVSFSYERFGDALEASAIIKAAIDSADDVLSAIKSSKTVIDVLLSDMKRGTAEALSVELPELTNVEVFDLLDLNDEQKSELAFDLFLGSIPWRKDPALSDRAEQYIKDEIERFPSRLVYFLKQLVNVALSPSSAFNAKLLDKTLRAMPAKKRDGVWAHALYENKTVSKTIVWFWKGCSKASENVVALAAMFLGWCTASTCRRIRDCATKALSLCFLRNPSLVGSFSGYLSLMDDDYIIERVLAAIYGAAANADQLCAEFVAAADDAYSFVYCRGETYPNIMVRNYADCLADLAIRKFGKDENDYPLIWQRGNSTWYSRSVSNEDIDEALEMCKKEYGEGSDKTRNLDWLIHSMTTEYGRGACAYGDFGRYVFGSHVSCWEPDFPNDQDLANLALNEILERLYDPYWHCSYDVKAKHYELSQEFGYERLTKKYQWIEMFRLLARLVDNYPPYRVEIEYDDKYKAVVAENARKFNFALQTGEFRHLEREEIGPDQYVVSRKKIYLPPEEVFYELEWSRDIDPTNIFPPNDKPLDEGCIASSLRNLNATVEYDQGNIGSYLIDLHEVVIEEELYVVLWTRTNIKALNETASEVYWEASAGFVFVDDVDALMQDYDRSLNHDLFAGDTLHIYCREFNAGAAFELDQRFRESECAEDLERVRPASLGYMWEPVRDGSAINGESVFIQYPSAELCKGFSLNQADRGVWSDGEKVVCMEKAYANGRCLLFRKDCLIDYLNRSNQALVWAEYFETTSSGGYRQRLWFIAKRTSDNELVFSSPKKDSFTLSDLPWYRNRKGGAELESNSLVEPNRSLES